MDSGFIIIDKPKSITSFGVVKRLRFITKIKKIGHAGTLDPLATGVLICAIGRENTKLIDSFVAMEKIYIASIELGVFSDTYDEEGERRYMNMEKKNIPSKEEILEVLKNFIGEIDQIPPIYSAKKINGKKYYDLARSGIDFSPEKHKIYIKYIKIISYAWPFVRVEVCCSKGTYIRSLVNDIGEKLGTGALLTDLRRTKIGDISIADAVNLESLTEENWKEKLFEKK